MPNGTMSRKRVDGTLMTSQFPSFMTAVKLCCDTHCLQVAAFLHLSWCWAEDRSLDAYFKLALKAAGDNRFLFPVKPKCHAPCQKKSWWQEVACSAFSCVLHFFFEKSPCKIAMRLGKSLLSKWKSMVTWYWFTCYVNSPPARWGVLDF